MVKSVTRDIKYYSYIAVIKACLTELLELVSSCVKYVIIRLIDMLMTFWEKHMVLWKKRYLWWLLLCDTLPSHRYMCGLYHTQSTGYCCIIRWTEADLTPVHSVCSFVCRIVIVVMLVAGLVCSVHDVCWYLCSCASRYESNVWVALPMLRLLTCQVSQLPGVSHQGIRGFHIEE